MTDVRTWLPLLAAAALAACGDGSTPGADAAAAPDAAPAAPDAAAAPDASSASSALVIGIPADFSGVTRTLVVAYHDEPTLTGAPDGLLHQADTPVVAAGGDLAIEPDASGVDGTFYLTAVLYMEGGGQFVPEPGVDYLGSSATSFDFDGGAIDLGRIDLALAP